ncbi:primosomal protein N' [Aurantivibrio plasticivorans]
MLPTLVLSIALPTPLRRCFDYLPIESTELPAPGCRVTVEFGRQQLVGIVVSHNPSSDVPIDKLKPIQRVIDLSPCLNEEQLSLLEWAAKYYQAPIGEAITAALPSLLRQGEPAQLAPQFAWHLTREGLGLPAQSLSRAPKQRQALDALITHKHIGPAQLAALGLTTPPFKELEKKGLAELVELDETPESAPQSLLAEKPLQLNEEQSIALQQISLSQYQCYLLEGATGSGKTEVYLQAITKALEAGKGALVLVPEIGLTPQLVGRFQRRFNVDIVSLHSGLSDKERTQGWIQAKEGKARIVIGTRSAIFTPIPNLGLIVIDEEHDLSFKQQDGFRYSARDLAVLRANRLGIPLLMGSATPGLETLYNAIQNRYQHLRLTRRAGDAKPPTTELIDIRGQQLYEGFSSELLQRIETTLAKSEQALVFINRRGFAPAMLCHDCGWIAECSNCTAKMTVHRHPPHLHCHHCDQQRPTPRQCPECRSQDLVNLGIGTERTEHNLKELFPTTPVIRIDRDTTRRKNAMENLLAEVKPGTPCILVGTQMLAKGHHFPDVTLVAILDIDSGLFSADFRAPERMGQLLIQVAGRAGREQKPGNVVIQSHHCDHPSIQSLIKEGYHRYARRLLRERQLAGLPPYQYMALFRAESKRPANALEFLHLTKKLLRQSVAASPTMQYIGPLPAFMERKQDRYCFQLQVIAADRQQLQHLLTSVCLALDSHALSRRTRWSIDVDPQDMS